MIQATLPTEAEARQWVETEALKVWKSRNAVKMVPRSQLQMPDKDRQVTHKEVNYRRKPFVKASELRDGDSDEHGNKITLLGPDGDYVRFRWFYCF